jgi:hypothetical protein
METYREQQYAVETSFPVVQSLYAVHSLGHTAGLKENWHPGTRLVHPGGWQVAKRGSVTSDTWTGRVIVEKLVHNQFVTMPVVEKILAQVGACTNGVVNASGDVAVPAAEYTVESDMSTKEKRRLSQKV